MSIVEFLLRRLDEEELTARRAADYRSRPGGGHGSSGYERWVWVDAETGERPPPNLHQDPLRVEHGALLRSEQEYPMQTSPGFCPGDVLRVRGTSRVKQAVADHIVRHDPVHVVADIDAKRRMVAAHTPTTSRSRDGDPACPTCVIWEDEVAVAEPFPCFTLLLLAQPYGDHAEHDPRWQERLGRRPLADPMADIMRRHGEYEAGGPSEPPQSPPGG